MMNRYSLNDRTTQSYAFPSCICRYYTTCCICRTNTACCSITLFSNKMNWPPDPKSWSEFPTECLWYLLPGGLFHLIAVPVILGAMATLAWFGLFRPRISTLMIFQAYLLISSMIVNGFWSCIIWGKLYWSVDYTSDFSVFMPIRSSQIDYSWSPEMVGGLNGVTLTQLNLVWASFAIYAWILAFLATRWTITTLSKRQENKSRHATPISRPVYMPFRNSNINPVIDTSPR